MQEPKQWIWWAIPVVVVAALGGALYYGRLHKEQPVAAKPPVAQPAATAASSAVNHPITPTASDKPLPTLDDSDTAVQESLAEVFGRSLESFLVPKQIVRHIVVTVDNLPRKKIALPMSPIKPTGGAFLVTSPDAPMLSEDNAARYAALIKVVQSADAAQIAAIYKRYYPLFQQAYVGLGYPDGYFNNRLIEVIDHLLATPELPEAVKLTQPSVFYQFADPALEERSAGQKVLFRMGNANAAVVKTKLRELRKEIAKQE
jgi:hypothetical protein